MEKIIYGHPDPDYTILYNPKHKKWYRFPTKPDNEPDYGKWLDTYFSKLLNMHVSVRYITKSNNDYTVKGVIRDRVYVNGTTTSNR
jgi:hypothetical protein